MIIWLSRGTWKFCQSGSIKFIGLWRRWMEWGSRVFRMMHAIYCEVVERIKTSMFIHFFERRDEVDSSSWEFILWISIPLMLSPKKMGIIWVAYSIFFRTENNNEHNMNIKRKRWICYSSHFSLTECVFD